MVLFYPYGGITGNIKKILTHLEAVRDKILTAFRYKNAVI